MSTQFFPELHTSSWKMTRTPQWKTGVQTAVTGNRTRNPLQTRPIWKWTLKSGILQTEFGDLQAIQNLYNAMYGRLDWFLWRDPEGESIEDPDVQINILGVYYWPVAFVSDSVDFDRFAYELWECATLSFEQVNLPILAYTQAQRPHGNILSAVLHLTSAHDAPDSGGGNFGAGASFQGVGTITPTPTWFHSTSSWDTRTDSTPADAASVQNGSLFLLLMLENDGSLTTPSSAEEFVVYDCYIDVTYEDLTTAVMRPTSYAIQVTNATGSVTDPANAIDADPATGATLSCSAYGGAGLGGVFLNLSNFA